MPVIQAIKSRVQWIGAIAALAASLMLFVSCQREAPPAEAPSGAAMPASIGPTAAPAGKAMAASGAMPVIDYRALGFSFPAPPEEERLRKPGLTVPAMNALCLACHKPGGSAPAHTDSDTMHTTGVSLACIECHGGPGDRSLTSVRADMKRADADYDSIKERAHIGSKLDPQFWKTPEKRQLSYARMLRETPDFIRFINPGDLRAARVACAGCHLTQVQNVPKSMMTHGAMLWSAAVYNNGDINRKDPVYGEFYGQRGAPAEVTATHWPTVAEARDRGILPALFPVPNWEITQPGNVLRVFERGGMISPNLGIPDPDEDPGRPDVKLSIRGFGTNLRTDPVFIGLQKTRLFDPTLNLAGTNDHPGDFRSAGCAACHVVYANDRSPIHSVFWANYGNRGESFSIDQTVNPAAGSNGPTTQPYKDPDHPGQAARPSGHPIQHVFVRNMPTSTCIVCHVHPGTNVLNSYLGYMWWDNESDGWSMYPRKQVNPTGQQDFEASQHNPEAAAAKGLWSDLYPDLVNHKGRKSGKDFLENITQLNPSLEHTHFADFHGHGWVFRAVFKRDREGRMVDYSGQPINAAPGQMGAKMEQGADFMQTAAAKDKHPAANVPVHLKDIHLEKGMQCVDCHFSTDSHGDGNLYGETRNAVAVNCVDCHGSSEGKSPILQYLSGVALGNAKEDNNKFLLAAFSGNAATAGLTNDQVLVRNEALIRKHFTVNDDLENPGLLQINTSYKQADQLNNVAHAGIDLSNMYKTWTVTQTADTLKVDFKPPDADDDGAKHHAALARYAHSVRKNMQWGSAPAAGDKGTAMELAHSNNRVSCYACHSSWNTSCFGCHLPQRANQRKEVLHNEGRITRNYTNYNYQTLRDDLYMLGVDSTVKNHVVAPVRSACAVVVSSQNVNRDWIYAQQQTVSAEGFAGTAFSPNFPHTVRSAETKQCSDCHISKANDNNAIMSQLLMQGTNAVNFIGRFAWVATGDEGVRAIAVTERDEPQAVIGSRLHEMAYPDNFAAHTRNGKKLAESYEHHGEVLDVQLRGEYLYAACGPNGFIAYDVANIDNKDFSERFSTAPVSPLGQRFYVSSKYATSICSPSTLAIDPARSWTQEDRAKHQPGWRPENEEGKITEIGDRTKVLEQHRKIHPLYGFLYLTDREEGLIVVGNPLDDPNKPGVTTLLDGDPQNNFLRRAVPAFNPGGLLTGARHMALYGTYAYISCDAGLVVLDMNDPLHPKHVTTVSGISHPRRVTFQFRYGFVADDTGLKIINVEIPTQPRLVASLPIADARDIYVCRTYGYVAAGKEGLIIVDLKNPEKPAIDQTFTDKNTLNDTTAIRVGMTNTSLFAYVADGRNGFKVLQLTSPDDTPTYAGFSPRPAPRQIAWYPTEGPALAISKGVDRDRAVDESGNQLAVFGRRGARPFTLPEQRKFYFHNVPADGSNPSGFYTVSDTPDTAAMTQPAADAPK